jgi:NTE family protein
MGGLVGSLYAMGWTPDEMDALLDRIDWEKILASSPPYEKRTFRRKQDARELPSQVELGLRDGISFPSGLNAGHSIGILFDRLSLPYSGLDSFDSLPIPFRCVATDMESGYPVVLEDGDLSNALRATMAIPGVFTPVELNGRILADGGILDNLPAETAKQMGADIVIAVQVGSPLIDRAELQSLLGMLDQTLTIMILENVRRSQRFTDILLTPEIGDYGTLEFSRTSEIVEEGYRAAEDKRVLLEALTLSEDKWQRHIQSRMAKRRSDLPTPSRLEISGVEESEKPSIVSKIEPQIGREIVPEKLEENLNSLYGSGHYYSIGYTMKDSSTLRVNARKKDYGPPFMRFRFNVDGTEFDHLRLGIGSRITFFDLGGYGSELQLDGSLGTPLGIGSEYYRPLAGGFFVAPRAIAVRDTVDIFEDGEQTAEFTTDNVAAGVDFGYGFGLSHDEVRVGYSIGHASYSIRIGPPTTNSEAGTKSEASIHYIHDSQDNPVIPRRGLRAEGNFHYFFEAPGATDRLTQLSARLSGSHALSEKNSLHFTGAGGITLDNDAPFLLQFTLGGPTQLAAYSRDELRGSRFFHARGLFSREIAELSLILPSKFYVTAWYELGSSFNRNRYEKLSHSIAGGLLLDSFLGPFFLGGSVGDEKRAKLFFLLGRLF